MQLPCTSKARGVRFVVWLLACRLGEVFTVLLVRPKCGSLPLRLPAHKPCLRVSCHHSLYFMAIQITHLSAGYCCCGITTLFMQSGRMKCQWGWMKKFPPYLLAIRNWWADKCGVWDIVVGTHCMPSRISHVCYDLWQVLVDIKRFSGSRKVAFCMLL